jgi:hypothetical protein
MLSFFMKQEYQVYISQPEMLYFYKYAYILNEMSTRKQPFRRYAFVQGKAIWGCPGGDIEWLNIRVMIFWGATGDTFLSTVA